MLEAYYSFPSIGLLYPDERNKKGTCFLVLLDSDITLTETIILYYLVVEEWRYGITKPIPNYCKSISLVIKLILYFEEILI